MAVKASQAQPVWIEVAVPRQAAPGDYEGRLVVRVEQEEDALPVALHVWDFEVPEDRHLSVINWGVFPGQMYREPPADNSSEYFRLYRDYCAFLVKHRQTDVMGAIDWIEQKADGSGGMTYDTSRLERQAEAAFAAGMRRCICTRWDRKPRRFSIPPDVSKCLRQHRDPIACGNSRRSSR